LKETIQHNPNNQKRKREKESFQKQTGREEREEEEKQQKMAVFSIEFTISRGFGGATNDEWTTISAAHDLP